MGLAVLAGCSNPAAEARPNLLVLVLEGARADHVGAYGYERRTTPNLDALGTEGIRFDRAYAPSPYGTASTAALWTGSEPDDLGLRSLSDSLPDGIPTLASVLQSRGYATSAIISDFKLGRSRGLARGFDQLDDQEAQGDSHISSDALADRAIAELERLGSQSDPFFLAVHFHDAHPGWHDHEGTEFVQGPVDGLRGGEDLDEWRLLEGKATEAHRTLLSDLYDEELHGVDRALGRVLSALDQSVLGPNTLVVVVGNSGQAHFEHGHVGPATGVFEESIRVPFVVRLPRRERQGAVINEPVAIQRMGSTVLELLGLKGAVQGPLAADSMAMRIRGTRPAEPRPVSLRFHFEPPAHRAREGERRFDAVIDGRFKLVRDGVDGTVALFDLVVDPKESEDVASLYPEECSRLMGFLRPSTAQLSPESGE